MPMFDDQFDSVLANTLNTRSEVELEIVTDQIRREVHAGRKEAEVLTEVQYSLGLDVDDVEKIKAKLNPPKKQASQSKTAEPLPSENPSDELSSEELPLEQAKPAPKRTFQKMPYKPPQEEKKKTLYDLIEGAKEELRDQWKESRYPEDLVGEIADSWVPIYTHDLLRMAADNMELATNEPELGPAFDGTPTPVNIIAANIYEELSNALSSELSDLQSQAGGEETLEKEESLDSTAVAPPGREEQVKELKKHKDVKNPWAVCLSGDTVIPCLDGISRKIEDMVDKGKFWFYSIDPEQMLVVPGLGWVTQIGEKEVYKIILDNKEEILCTKEHRWMLRNGEYKSTIDLMSGDSLMPLYKKTYGRSKHEEVYHPGLGQYTPTHVAMSRASKNYCPGIGHILHHVNHHANDNRPENLKWVTGQEHGREHMEERRAAIKAKNSGENNWTTQSIEHKEKMRQYFIEKWKDEKWAKKQSHMLQNAAKSAGQLAGLSHERRALKREAELLKLGGPTAICHECKNEKPISVFCTGRTDMWCKSCMRARSRSKREGRILGVSANHKIASIQKMDNLVMVYDVTVEKWENFAIESGVFSHNSWSSYNKSKESALVAEAGLKSTLKQLKRQLNNADAEDVDGVNNLLSAIEGVEKQLEKKEQDKAERLKKKEEKAKMEAEKPQEGLDTNASDSLLISVAEEPMRSDPPKSIPSGEQLVEHKIRFDSTLKKLEEKLAQLQQEQEILLGIPALREKAEAEAPLLWEFLRTLPDKRALMEMAGEKYSALMIEAKSTLKASAILKEFEEKLTQSAQEGLENAQKFLNVLNGMKSSPTYQTERKPEVRVGPTPKTLQREPHLQAPSEKKSSYHLYADDETSSGLMNQLKRSLEPLASALEESIQDIFDLLSVAETQVAEAA